MFQQGVGCCMAERNTTEMMCMVCGNHPSYVTAWRLWLRELVRSDECVECHAYMNEHFGVSPKPVVYACSCTRHAVVAQTAPSKCKVVDILTRKELAS